jgi:hypothetical protein
MLTGLLAVGDLVIVVGPVPGPGLAAEPDEQERAQRDDRQAVVADEASHRQHPSTGSLPAR